MTTTLWRSLLFVCFACTSQKDPSTPSNTNNATNNSNANTPSNTKQEGAALKPHTPACGAHTYAFTKGSFKHNRSSMIAMAASAAHASMDGLFVQGVTPSMKAKFAYGELSKDLEDEPIDVAISTCSGWKSMGNFTTDDDGIVNVKFEGEFASLPSGTYPMQFIVSGDGSKTEATLRIFPKGTHLIVFDIDGTMTTSDEEIFKDFKAELLEPLSKKDYVPEAYPGGPELTRLHAERGAQLLYMTGRPYWLTTITREWLTKLGYAPATLKLTNSTEEALPTQSGVGTYKLNILKDLIGQGFVVDLAYGNASTDIYAYLGAGIDPKNVYIIGKHGGGQGTNAMKDTWMPEVERAKTLPKIEQPPIE
jgi:hypothetical protein